MHFIVFPFISASNLASFYLLFGVLTEEIGSVDNCIPPLWAVSYYFICSPLEGFLCHTLFELLLLLPTTPETLFSMRGGDPCISPSRSRNESCIGIYVTSSLLCFVSSHPLLPLVTLFFSSVIHPSVHKSIHSSIHQSPEDRNASPALLSSTWWACYLCICVLLFCPFFFPGSVFPLFHTFSIVVWRSLVFI